MTAPDKLRGRRTDQRFRGFTLVELLVAAALTVLIAGVLVALISNTLANWDRAEATLTTESEARVVLDWLERDLDSAWIRDDGKTWLAATVQAEASGSGVWVNGIKPSVGSLDHTAVNLADARFGVAGVWLRLFTAPQLGATEFATAPVAVSYQIIRRPPTPTDSISHHLLYRAEVTAAATLNAGYDLDSVDYTTGTDTAGSPGNVVRPGRGQALAENIIDFGVRFFAYAPDAATGEPSLQQVFPASATDLEYRAQESAISAVMGRPFPAVVEVMIRVLTAEGARKLAALEAGQTAGDWWTVALANSKVFVRRIQVPAKGA